MENEEKQLIETVDEEGNVINFELFDIVEVDEQEYALLLPTESEEGEDDEIVLMKLTKDGEDYLFETIDNDEEFEKVLKPFLDDYDNFILSYIMPEVIAYYIANSYYRGSMYEGSFLQHYNSAKDLINLFGEDYEQMKAEVFKLLKIKYALIVVNEDPLDLKQIEY